MYQNIYVQRKTDHQPGIIYLWDDILGLQKFKLSDVEYAYRKDPNGKYTSLYGDKLSKITKFNPRDPNLFEADVNPETRFLIDAYEDSDEVSTNHRIIIYDIETSTEGGYPTIDKGDKEITAISIYDVTAAKYYVFILDKQNRVNDYDNKEVQLFRFDDEEGLLQSFLTKWEEINPTIISGWNIDGFDNPYIYHRLITVFGKKEANRLSSIGKCYYNKKKEKMIIAGISSLDYMFLYKKFSGKVEPSYTLAAIGKKTVNIEKLTYDGSLDDLFEKDIDKYIDYNLTDVKIVVAMDKKFQFIELARGICHAGHVPYECFSSPSRFIEGAILLYLRRNKKVGPNSPIRLTDEEFEIEEEDNKKNKFEGAYVKDPIPGRYEWVYDLDLTSMYPNIMISLNISPETKFAVIDKIEMSNTVKEERIKELSASYVGLSNPVLTEEEYIDGQLYKFNSFLFVRDKIDNYFIGNNSYTPNQIKQLITENNLSLASNGAMYKLPENGKRGVIPSILVDWFDQRKELRKLAKKYAEEKDHEKYEFYDRRQQIIKLCLNAIFGTLGQKSFRFYDVDNAMAITLTGQATIKTAMKSINKYYTNILGKYKITYDDGSIEYTNVIP